MRDDVLVVADLPMPGTNSLNVMRELHAKGRRPRAEVTRVAVVQRNPGPRPS